MHAKITNYFFLKDNKLVVLEGVYEPLDDSYLLAESIPEEKEKTALDLGCGSGIQGINLFLLGAKKVVFADKNQIALKNAEQNLQSLKLKNYELIETDLFENIKEKFDVITFNPPYVDSESIKYIEVDGGKKGREILDRFLAKVKQNLNKNGEVFFVQSMHNGLIKTKKILKNNGFKFEIIAKKKLFFEELIVFKAWF